MLGAAFVVAFCWEIFEFFFAGGFPHLQGCASTCLCLCLCLSVRICMLVHVCATKHVGVHKCVCLLVLLNLYYTHQRYNCVIVLGRPAAAHVVTHLICCAR